MRQLRYGFGIAVVVLLSTSAFSAPVHVEIGNITDIGDAPAPAASGTAIDLSHPASATGTIDTVTFYWSQGRQSCVNAAAIKIFRRFGNNLMQVQPPQLLTPSPGALNTFTLVTPLPVAEGDLIGISLSSSVCGSVQTNVPPLGHGLPDQGYVAYPFNTVLNTSYPISAAAASQNQLLLGGTGTISEYVALVIPVVGSTAGAFGSNFKTLLQISDMRPNDVKLVFRAASNSDPVITNPAPVSRKITYLATSYSKDVLPEWFSAAGIGSLDIVMSAGNDPPAIVTRIYNDSVSLGIPGVEEPLVDPSASGLGSSVLHPLEAGLLITPADLTRTRFNIGVRTLYSGVTFTATISDGTTSRDVTQTLPPNWVQLSDAGLFLGVTIRPNQAIQISVASGSAIFYGSTIDNATNAPSIQLAHVVSITGIR